MGVYDRQIASARRLIAAKGEACVWITQASTPDNAKPWIETGDAPHVETPCSIVWLQANRQYQELIRALQGTELVEGQRYGLVVFPAPVGFEPDKSHSVRRANNVVMTVAAIDPLAPNGETIFYKVRFNR